MKIKSSWKVTEEQITKTKVEFSWNTTLGEIYELARIIGKIEGYADRSKDRNVIRELGDRFRNIYQESETKIKDTTVEVEIDPNPNAIKL